MIRELLIKEKPGFECRFSAVFFGVVLGQFRKPFQSLQRHRAGKAASALRGCPRVDPVWKIPGHGLTSLKAAVEPALAGSSKPGIVH